MTAAQLAGHLSADEKLSLGTDIQRRLGVKTSRDEPLSRFTTMRVGGPADLFAEVRNLFELRGIARFARSRGIPLFVIGRGSDLVISDAGIAGLVVLVRAQGERIDGEQLIADAGLPMAKAATITREAGLSGLEFGLAIPGTVGGAVWANAGAHDADVRGCLVEASVLTADGTEATLSPDDLRLEYRDSRLKHVPRRGSAGDRDERDVPAHARGPQGHRRAPRRDPSLAPGAPAHRHALGRERLPQPRRRVGRPDHRRARPQGPSRRRRAGQRAPRQFHRQHRDRDRGRRPPPRRGGARPRPG